MRKRGRSYYRDNHTSQLKLALIRRRKAYNKKREFLIKLKDRACADCKNRFPFYVMDFDHLDKKTKINNVSYMFTRNWSLDRIQLEVGKCQVVCANCHRIRTYKNLDRRNAEVAKVVTAGA